MDISDLLEGGKSIFPTFTPSPKMVVQAVASLIRIIDRGVTDRENAEQIEEIKESLNALEGGRVLDI